MTLHDVIQAAAPGLFAQIANACHAFGCDSTELVGVVNTNGAFFCSRLVRIAEFRQAISSDANLREHIEQALKSRPTTPFFGQTLLVIAADQENYTWVWVRHAYFKKATGAA